MAWRAVARLRREDTKHFQKALRCGVKQKIKHLKIRMLASIESYFGS